MSQDKRKDVLCMKGTFLFYNWKDKGGLCKRRAAEVGLNFKNMYLRLMATLVTAVTTH
jgi:hypothetical protein